MSAASRPYCRLSSEPIVLQEVIDAVLGADSTGQGALTTFTGIVRDNNLGKQVTRLEYQAYPKMVLSILARIIEGIEADLPGTRVAIVHRDGVLAVGDIAVVIAASSPHRDAAFQACRRAIEELKADVPIWKKEVYPDGHTWREGS